MIQEEVLLTPEEAKADEDRQKTTAEPVVITPAPEKTETPAALERNIEPERLNQEGYLITRNVANRRIAMATKKEKQIKEAQDKPKAKHNGEEETEESLTEGEQVLLSLAWLKTAKDASFVKEGPEGIPMQAGKEQPITLSWGGEPFTVTGIFAIKDDQVICVGFNESNPTAHVSHPFPRDEVVVAAFRSESAAILADMNDMPAERAFFEVLVNPNSVTPEKKNEIIATAAEATGMVTRSGVEAVIQRQKQEDLSPTQQQELSQIQELLQGKNVVDQESMDALTRLGLLALERQKDALDRQEQTPDVIAKKQQLAEVRQAYQMLTQGENSPLSKYYARVESGQVDPQEAQRLIAALHSGDTKTFVEVITESIHQDKTLSEGEKEQQINQINMFSGYSDGNIMKDLLLCIGAIGLTIGKAALT